MRTDHRSPFALGTAAGAGDEFRVAPGAEVQEAKNTRSIEERALIISFTSLVRGAWHP
jgi:hypothetical protein